MKVTVKFTHFDVAKEESFSTERALEGFLNSADKDPETDVIALEIANREWTEA